MLNTKRIIGKSERKVEAMLMMQQFLPFLTPESMPEMLKYLEDAAGDPAFEKLLSSMNRVSQQPAQAQPAAAPQGPQ
jgi:hypothetical protein